MMRPLREDERDEIESVKHLIKYVITKQDIEAYKIWDAVLQLNSIGEKYVSTNTVTESELSELCDLDDMKELVTKLMSKFAHLAKTQEETGIPQSFQEDIFDG